MTWLLNAGLISFFEVRSTKPAYRQAGDSTTKRFNTSSFLRFNIQQNTWARCG